MRKTIVKTLLCGTLIISLTGCGGIQNTVENSTTKEQAKTETTDVEISFAEPEPAKVIPSVYPHNCTKNCFYTADEMYIVQCDLDGKELQKFEMPGVDGKNKHEAIGELYVTDEEILYTVYCPDGKSGEYEFYDLLCSVPVQQDENGEQLLVEQTEKVFRVDDGMRVLYADKEVVAFTPPMDYVYYEYDRVNKKQIPINRGDKDEYYYTLSPGKGSSWGGDCFETVLLARYKKNGTGEDDTGEDDHGIYAHKAGSQEIQKVATHYIDSHSKGLHMTAVAGKVYYTCIHDGYSYENTDKYSYDIWCYDSATGKNSVLVSEEDIKKTEPEFSDISELFADENSLYAYGDNKNGADFLIRISVDTNGKVEVEPEKELNQIWNSDKDKHGYPDVVDIIGSKCYYEIYYYEDQDDVKRFVFDLSSKESKQVKKSDPEYFVWKYDDLEWE